MKNKWQSIALIILGVLIIILIGIGIGKILYEENIRINNSSTEKDDSINKYIYCDKNFCSFNDKDIYKITSTYEYKCEDNVNKCIVINKSIINNKIIIKDSNDYYVYDLDTKEKSKLTTANLTSLEFEKIDIDNIEIGNEFMPHEILIDFDFDNNDDYITLENGENKVLMDGEFVNELIIVLENNSAYFKLNNEKIAIMDNVKKIYIQSIQCGGERSIDFLTNNGDIYQIESFNVQYNDENINNSINEIKEIIKTELKKINNNLKYTNLMVWGQGYDSCKLNEIVVGISNDNKKYIVSNDCLLEKYYFYIVPNYLYENVTDAEKVRIYPSFEIGIGDKILDYKYKTDFADHVILTQDNYLYDAIYNKLLNNAKLTELYKQKTNETYLAIFANKEMVIFD